MVWKFEFEVNTMQRIREMWSRLDVVSRVILFSGLLLAIVLLVQKMGTSAIAVVVIMCFFILNHISRSSKTAHRLYGTMYFHMPDGEIVPRYFELVKSEYQRGNISGYNGRRVSLRFRYTRQEEDGVLDTDFGLKVETRGCEAARELLPTLKRGMFLSVTGHLIAQSKSYFTIGELEDIRIIREDELYALMPEK